MDDYPDLESDASERKEVLARFVASIEGIDDEALHAIFVNRAVKKSIWDENDLLDGLTTHLGWEKEGQCIEENFDFDTLFVRLGGED